jgi:acetylornithine deacetylase
MGFEVHLDRVIGERSNLFARLGPDDAGTAFVSHLDTVPPGEGWEFDPLEPVLRDGRLIGLGACDPKASFAAFVAAVSRLLDSDWRPRHALRLVGLVDEEQRQAGVQTWMERESPERKPFFAIVGEPTRLDVVCAHKGDLYVEAEFSGMAAHSSDPTSGASAIYAAAEFIQVIESIQAGSARWGEPDHPLTGRGSWSVGTVSGGTGFSIVPGRALVQIDRRFNPGDDPWRSIAIVRHEAEAIASARPGISVEVRVVHIAPGMQTDRRHPAVTALLDSAAAVTGRSNPIGWAATCDANIVSAAGIPVVVFGPGDLFQSAHRPNESVSLAEVECAVKILVDVIPRIDTLERRQSGRGIAP